MTILLPSTVISQHQEKLLSNLKKQQLKGLFTDIKIVSKDSVFWAHACVLAPYSNLISKVFDINRNPCEDSVKWSAQYPCVLKLSCSRGENMLESCKYCQECIQKVIDFVYVGQIKIEENHLTHVKNIALFFEIEDLLSILNQIHPEGIDENFNPGSNRGFKTTESLVKSTVSSEQEISVLKSCYRDKEESKCVEKVDTEQEHNICSNLQTPVIDQNSYVLFSGKKTTTEINLENPRNPVSTKSGEKKLTFKAGSNLDRSLLSDELKIGKLASQEQVFIERNKSSNTVELSTNNGSSKEAHSIKLSDSCRDPNACNYNRNSEISSRRAISEENSLLKADRLIHIKASGTAHHRKRVLSVKLRCTDSQVKESKNDVNNMLSETLIPEKIGSENILRISEEDLNSSEVVLKSSHQIRESLSNGCSNQNEDTSVGHDLLCRFCPYKGTSVSNLLDHKLDASHEEDLECFLCCSKFPIHNQLHQHLLQHKQFNHKKFELKNKVRKKNVFTCEFCGKKIQWQQNYLRHLDQHKKPNIKCSECGFITSSSQSLKYHHKKEHSKFFHTCYYNNCSFKSVKKGNLKDHILHIHESLKLRRFKCSECSVTFSQKRNLQRHKSLYHSSVSKWFKCQFCQYSNRRYDNFQNHLLTKHKTINSSESNPNPYSVPSLKSNVEVENHNNVCRVNGPSNENTVKIESSSSEPQNSFKSNKFIDAKIECISNTNNPSAVSAYISSNDMNSDSVKIQKDETSPLKNPYPRNFVPDPSLNIPFLNLSQKTSEEEVSNLKCQLTQNLSFDETTATFRCHNFCHESTNAVILNEMTGELTCINLVAQQSIESISPPLLNYSQVDSENRRTLILNESTGELYLIQQTNEKESNETNDLFSSKIEDDANLLFDPIEEDDDFSEFLDIDPSEIINENNSSTEIPVLNEWTGEINLLPNNFPGGPFLDEQTGQLSVFDLLDNDLVFDCLDEPTSNIILNENTGEIFCKTPKEEKNFILNNEFSDSTFVNEDFTYDNNIEYCLNENTGHLSISWPGVSRDSNFSFLLNELTGELSIQENNS